LSTNPTNLSQSRLIDSFVYQFIPAALDGYNVALNIFKLLLGRIR